MTLERLEWLLKDLNDSWKTWMTLEILIHDSWKTFRWKTLKWKSPFQEIIYYFLPYSLVMAFLGRIYLLETLYVGYLNFGCGAFLMTWFLFFIGIVSVIRGSTNYEARKQLIEEDQEMEILEKFRLVFGNYGLLHFLVPVLPVNNNEAVCEPGYRWLLGPRYTWIKCKEKHIEMKFIW